MRIAILADIHGNLPAFEAALTHARRLGYDQLVIAGDLINGAPDSRSCWDLAQSLGATILRGNHERYVYDFDAPDAPPIWKTERFGPVQWTVAQFSAAERAAIATLPIAFETPDLAGLYITHASPRRDNDSVQSYTAEHEIAAMFEGVTAPMIVRGHDHWCQVRLWAKGAIVTTGSVGMTLDEYPTARYVMLARANGAWLFEHHAVDYDVDATVQRFESTGYLNAGGPMARLLLREIALASPHIVPFLRLYERWAQQEPISLTAGVERFLNYY